MKKIIYHIILILITIFLILCLSNSEAKAYTEEEYRQKLNESVAYAMSLIDDDMNDYEKAFIFAQYCQEGNIYSMQNNHQTAEGVFVDHTAVCAGYANAFKLLCDTAGIPCETMISNKAAHEWCICYLEGEWTYVDITRGVSAQAEPQAFGGKLFVTKDEFDIVTVRDKAGISYSTTAKNAKEQGLEIIESYYFEDAYYRYSNLNDNYFPEGVDIENFNFSSNFSRIYYDDNYKYYEERNLNDTICSIYREDRNNGTKEKLATAFCYDYGVTGIVKDNQKIYYIGTDGKSIYSMDLNGENKTKEFNYTGSEEVIGGIFVQDGYIKYTLRVSETSRDATWVEWKKLETAVSTGTYTLNDSEHQYMLEYIQTSKGIVISSCKGIGSNEPSGNIYIPDTINNHPVIGIGEYAFSDSKLQGELTLPKDLEYIGNYAFNFNKNITKINFNEKLKSIGMYGFYYCQNLSGTLEMPDSLKYIGIGAFRDCNYNNIEFSDNLIFISSSSFSWNRDLDGVIVIPEGVITVGDSAFRYTSVDAAILPETLINLGNNAFCDYFSDNDFEDLVIKSKQMKSFYSNEDYTLYLIANTETSNYADNNNIQYKDLNSVKPNITFEEENINLAINTENYQLKYKVTPKFFEGYDTSWSSSDINTASVDNNGIIIPKKLGTVTITLSIDGNSKRCTINIINNIPEGYKISLNYSNYQFDSLNEQLILNDEYIMSNSITWSSSNEKVAIVDSNGKVIPKSGGFTYIKATTDEYGKDDCWIYVCVLRTLSDGNKAYAGDLDRNGKFDANDAALILNLSNKTGLTENEIILADLTGDGVVNANDAAVILDLYKYNIFSPGNYKPITNISLNTNSMTLAEGQKQKLTPIIVPEDTTDSMKIDWSSSNSYIATVDENGYVTSVSGGTAIITATTSNGLKATCNVTSNAPIKTQTISGKITNVSDKTKNIVIEVLEKSTGESINKVTVSGNDTSYKIDGIPFGEYILKATHNNISIKYEISVQNQTIEQDIAFYLKGDINKDGKVTLYDAFRILRSVILGGNLTEEQEYIMDYNDDGKVTLYDAFRFLRQAILN